MGILDTVEARRVSPDRCGELTEKTVFINRVAKVVKGGRRFSFSALVVCGDGEGHIGFGLGKAADVPEAIRKGSEQARKSIVKIPIRGTTIPHDVVGKYGAARVMMRPAVPGTGVIAGSVVRAVAELAGIKDILTKCVKAHGAQNTLLAAICGLLMLQEPEAVAQFRGIPLEELDYSPFGGKAA